MIEKQWQNNGDDIIMDDFRCKKCDSYEENIIIDRRRYRGCCYTYEIDVLELYEDKILNPDDCKYFESIEE